MGLLFDTTATVYGRGASGAFDTVLKANLACRLVLVSRQAATTNSERAQLAAVRSLRWEASYVMPQYCQIEIDGLRWNLVSTNAFQTLDGPSGTAVFKRADVVRAA